MILCYFEYRRFKAQGVIFNDSMGFSHFRDMATMKKAVKDNPTDYPWSEWQIKALGVDALPPITGVIFPGKVGLSVNSVEFLNDIYVNQNKYHTKFWAMRKRFGHFIPNSILFQDKDENLYVEKRKTLSAAFFKQKLISMTKIIKEVTLKEIKRIQSCPSQETDLVKMTISLYSRIIINCSVGMGQSQTTVPFEQENGVLVNVSISDSITSLFMTTL
jgi:hypothetical protein